MINPKIDISRTFLETERLMLRPFKEEDLQDFFEYASVPDVGEAAGWKHHRDIAMSGKILDLFIKDKKTFAIVYKQNNKVIGSLGIEKSQFPRTYCPGETARDIGYVLSKEYWGHGLMSEAVKRVIEYCFKELNLDPLTIGHFLDNHRSQRVIEKMGFTYVYTKPYMTSMGITLDSREYILNNPR